MNHSYLNAYGMTRSGCFPDDLLRFLQRGINVNRKVSISGYIPQVPIKARLFDRVHCGHVSMTWLSMSETSRNAERKSAVSVGAIEKIHF